MIELAQHIKTLLTDNDCVIVPELGGFIAHYTPAMWMEERNMFLPPTRMIGFNPQLKMNDGLLVQSYMAAENLNFSKASQRLQHEVSQLISNLHTKGEIILTDIGSLRLSIYNTFEFIPCQQQIQAPALFGFAPLNIQKISATQPVSKQIPFPTSSVIKNDRKPNFKISINASFLSNAVAIAAIVILFFTLSIPVENTEVIKGNYAQLFPTDMFEEIAPQSLAITPLAIHETPPTTYITIIRPTDKTKVTDINKKNENKIAPRTIMPSNKPTMPKVTVNYTKDYHIIVASVGTKYDAQSMADELVKKGFSDAKAIIGDGKMRVCIDSYTNETEAYRALNKLRQNKNYKNAWILKKKQEQ